MQQLGEKYLRKSALPTIFCPGCGDGIILGAFIRAVEEIGVYEDLALVGGIGCSGWLPVYINADVMHVLHGRAIPFATGLKLSGRKRKVVVFSGDGDNLAIGGNHFLHACRRNIDLTVVMLNNSIYGMTGGQTAPTTPHMSKSQTSPYGNPENPLDACKLAECAGATYVARWTAAHPRQLTASFAEAMQHKGFAFIEVMSQCPTQTGRYMKGGMNGVELLNEMKENSINIQQGLRMTEQELAEKIVVGVLHRENKPEFSQTMAGLVEAGGGGR